MNFLNLLYPLIIRAHIYSKVPSKREREQEPEAPQKVQKVQKILGATSASGTRIFETIAEKSGANFVCMTQENY